MKSITTIYLITISGLCFSQTDTAILFHSKYEKSYGLYFQYNGITKPYLEFGIGKSTDFFNGHHPFTTGSFISSEAKIDFRRTVLGPKIGVWASGGVAPISMGLNLIYYGDIANFKNGGLRFRPEFGIGIFNFRASAGVNIPIFNYKPTKEFVSLFTVGVMYYVPIIIKKE